MRKIEANLLKLANMKIIPVLLFIVLLCDVCCQSQSINSQQLETQKLTFDESTKTINLSEIENGKDTLTYENYTLEKQFKSHPDLVEKAKTVEYAVLRKDNKKLKEFDLLEHPLSVVNFGWVSFLGNDEKQIFVSQTAPRLGNHWIISFKPKFKIIFNSSEYNVSAEDFFIVDLDKDDVYELSFANNIALKLNSQALIDSVPSTEVIFKFNPKQNNYFPANPQFADYLLRDVAEQSKAISRENKDAQFADVLNIALKYFYAGKEKEAWDFFEKQYNFEDKDTRKNAIKRALEKDIIYKTLKRIYKQNELRQ